MKKKQKTDGLLSDKLIDAKGEELEKFLQKEKVEMEKEANQTSTTDHLNLPRMAFGIKGLAGILKVSTSTVARWRAEGILDDVTFNKGLKSATSLTKCYRLKRNVLLIRNPPIQSARPFQCAYHPLTP